MNISVVIPCFRAESTLREAVLPACAAYEVIVVDDASPGGCRDLVASWGLSNVRVVAHETNLGLGAARNTGIQAAKGDWVAFLDADDAFEPQWHERLQSFLAQQPDVDWAYHPVREWTGSRLGAVRYGDHPQRVEDWVIRRPAIAPSACILRRAVALEHPFDTSRVLQGTEDLELWVRLWTRGFRPVRWTDEAFTWYRIGRGMSAELDAHTTKIRMRWAQFVERGWIPPDVLQQAERELQRQKARSYHKAGAFRKAQRAYLAAGPSAKNMLLAAAAALHLKI